MQNVVQLWYFYLRIYLELNLQYIVYKEKGVYMNWLYSPIISNVLGTLNICLSEIYTYPEYSETFLLRTQKIYFVLGT